MSLLYATASPSVRAEVHRTQAALAAFAYATLVIYGSLYPFSGWISSVAPFAFLSRPLSETRFSLGDVVTNLFAYVPLGLLACRALVRLIPAATAIVSATLIGLALSGAVELVQAFLPSRVQSNLDLLMNTIGAALGALLGAIPVSKGRVAGWVREMRSDWVAAGVLADIALIALAAWAASRLVPFVPSLDVGKFRASLAPLAAGLAQPKSISVWLALSEACYWAGFGIVLRTIIPENKPANGVLAALAAGLLLAQVPIVNHYLRLETLLGCGAGLGIAVLLARSSLRMRARVAFVLLFAGFCIAESLAVPSGGLPRFNWVPFRGHMTNTLNGISSLLEAIGLCVALVWAARCATDERSRRWMAWSGGVLAVAGAFFLEIAQRRIPGRIGDITMPLVFAFTWVATWRARESEVLPYLPAEPTAAPLPGARALPQSHRATLIYYLLVWLGLAVGFWLASRFPAVPYNVRELIYAGHPWRSAALLSAALVATIALPAWLVFWSLRAGRGFLVWPIALLINGYAVWLMVASAVPRESIHDIVGTPVLAWPGQTETCIRFIAVHAATTLAVSGGVVVALALLRGARRAPLAAAWVVWTLLLAPFLHWGIVTRAATDNLTELMRGGGSATTSLFLGTAVTLTFASGSFISAGLATRRRIVALVLAVACALTAYVLYKAGSEPALLKYGKVFSAMQFLLSPDRRHYVVGAELLARYAIVYVLLAFVVTLLQQPAWAAMATRGRMPR